MATRKKTEDAEVLDGEEVIISELAPGAPGGYRQLRVYDKAEGDFLVDVPSDARVTFGYFNPAVSGDGGGKYGGHMGGYGPGAGAMTMKTTALRVYQGKENQIACFLGVSGFRDASLKVTRLIQKVTIEHNFEDDGLGNQDVAKRVRKALNKADENDIAF